MRIHQPSFVALLLLALLGVTRVTAQIVVNIDARLDTEHNSQAVYFGQGAYADPGHNFWNAVTSDAGGSNLTASDGITATDISISFGGTVPIGFGGTPAFAAQLLADYYYTYSTATFTIGGLTAGHTYDFYFYSQPGSSGQTNRDAIFTLDGNSQSLTADFANSFELGINYVKFTLTPSGTSLNGSFMIDALNGGIEAEFNGVQIVQTAIPEPATYAVLTGTMVLAAVLVLRRRYARN